jgi:hypothetical protein
MKRTLNLPVKLIPFIREEERTSEREEQGDLAGVRP